MIKKVFLILIAVLAFWLISIMGCEIQTSVFKNQFEGIEEFKEFADVSEFVKIIKYTPNEAVVYFVYRDKTMGNVIFFKRNGNSWKYNYWDTIWSVSGNADKTVWPYWWHCLYFFYPQHRL